MLGSGVVVLDMKGALRALRQAQDRHLRIPFMSSTPIFETRDYPGFIGIDAGCAVCGDRAAS